MDKAQPAKRLRVLISAHEFSPERGSECAVGWNIVTRMARHHEVTVLCADGPALQEGAYRDEVARYFSRCGAIGGLNVVFVAQPPAALRFARLNRRLMKLTRGVGWQPLYYLGLDHWHWAARQRAGALGLENFDLVHQLTPISFRKPGYLWETGLPFFWGPVGGMHRVPRALARTGGFKSLLFESLRSWSIGWQTRRSAPFQAAVRKAVRVWAITRDEAVIIDRTAPGKSAIMLETSSPPGLAGRARSYDARRPLRVCWSGGHDPVKALPLLLHALKSLEHPERVALDILGKGPETGKWQRLAGSLSLPEVNWLGHLPYQQALQAMGRADILIHSSFREGTPHVVLEALSWGMPVICHDACGMAVAVDGSCGIKIPLVNPRESIAGFRAALERLLGDPQLVGQLSRGALQRAAQLGWDAKVQEIARAYSSRTDGSGPASPEGSAPGAR